VISPTGSPEKSTKENLTFFLLVAVIKEKTSATEEEKREVFL
jgi:hypothetical protein